MDKTVLRNIRDRIFLKFLKNERERYNNDNYSRSFYDFVNSIERQVNLLEKD